MAGVQLTADGRDLSQTNEIIRIQRFARDNDDVHKSDMKYTTTIR